MPAVCSRTCWGSPDGEGSRATPVYYRATHLVVHHTADSNSLKPDTETWWGDRVRAIWSFHTYTRGWGDIGYNFLVAPTGEIFEGRAGAYPDFTNDPVGFHDTGNYGSMGVALIGTYSSEAPTSAAQDSLVQLLGWKANQRGIDPLGSSYYYGCDISRYCGNAGAITPNIAGHRDVANNPAGYTACPGSSAYSYLPSIRSRVNALLNGIPDNGDNVIDNLEVGQNDQSGFYDLSEPGATWHTAGCGDAGNTYYTYNMASGTPENKAKWRKTGLPIGNYRIFTRIPQGCGLSTPATSQARYSVWQAGSQIGAFTISQNTSAEWIELTQSSGPLALIENPNTPGYAWPVEVHLNDITGEPDLSRVIYFDSVRFVKEVPQGKIALDSVSYDRTTIASGDILSVTFTLKNIGAAPLTLPTQDPQPGTSGDPASGYVYDEGECFLGNSSLSYPIFPKETGRFRVMLGYDGFDSSGSGCSGGTNHYPWRWGISPPPNDPDQVTLDPGETISVVGAVRFRNYSTSANRTLTLRTGLINEYVEYVATGAFPQTITITPERRPPLAVSYDSNLQPMAHVYQLTTIPDTFLARTRNPLSIVEGQYLGSFAWDGSYQNWGTGGPAGASEMFVVMQTRIFNAPTSGTYTFELTSDDGAWLWIDGEQLLDAHGLHPERVVTGTLQLSAGEHILSLKYFERSGEASLGYRWKLPGASSFSTIPVSIGGAASSGSTISGPIQIVADDLGGTGIASIHWSLDGINWTTASGNTLTLQLEEGSYNLRYQATDAAGNSEQIHQLLFTVDSTPPSSTIESVTTTSTGVLHLTLAGSDNLAGIASYRIEVYDLDTGATRFLSVAPDQQARFIGTPGHRYEFRSQAVDRVGNIEARPSLPDAVGQTPADAVFHHLYLPLLAR
ncbi:MAG: N-acetylmuramoyl-L-alanine amidase [Herpetosiphonaceae bacterium]|nr:MAG: N-acetylmuramoyl-L-alanine amidase [Herpetosiphonaceae bacterium]